MWGVHGHPPNQLVPNETFHGMSVHDLFPAQAPVDKKTAEPLYL